MRDYRPKESKRTTQIAGGKDFNYYLGIIVLPVIVVVIAEIILNIFAVPVYFFWLIDIVSFIYVGWAVYWKRKDSFREAGTAAVMMGVLIGLLMAVFRLIYFHKLYLIFNLIAEPIRSGLLGLLVVWLIHLVISLSKNSKSPKNKDSYLSSLVKRIDHKK